MKDVTGQDTLGRVSGDLLLGRRRNVGLGILCVVVEASSLQSALFGSSGASVCKPQVSLPVGCLFAQPSTISTS